MLQEVKDFINKNDVLNVNAVSGQYPYGKYVGAAYMTIFVWLDENTKKEFFLEGYYKDLSWMFLNVESYFKNNK